MSGYIEDIGGPLTGTYGQYIEDNNVPSSFNGNFGGLFTGVLQYLRSDLGLGKTGSIVNTWADQSGNGVNVTEGIPTVGIGTVTTGLNSHAGIAGGTGGQYGNFILDFVAPGTTPIFFWGVIRLISTSAQGWLTGSQSAAAVIYNTGANATGYNTNSVAVAETVGAWGRIECAFTGSTSDYIKFGSAITSGSTFGNIDPLPSRGLFATAVFGTNPGNYEVLTLVTLNNVPSLAQLNAASAAAQTFYGVSVSV